MKKKITLKNINSFIEGNVNKLVYELGGKSKEYQEQIAYRALQCNDCFVEGTFDEGPRHCKQCGCSLPGKWHTVISCNGGERFPDLMSDEDWIKYKEENQIK